MNISYNIEDSHRSVSAVELAGPSLFYCILSIYLVTFYFKEKCYFLHNFYAKYLKSKSLYDENCKEYM